MGKNTTAREWLEFWDCVLQSLGGVEAAAELDRLHNERA